MDIFFNLLVYSVFIYFFVYLIKYSDFLKSAREFLTEKLGETMSYPLKCTFCATFHISWMVWILTFGGIPFYLVFCAPVINLILDLVIRNLIKGANREDSGWKS